MTKSIDNLEFSIFSAHDVARTEAQILLHNKVYDFWYRIWNEVFSQSESMESLDTDDFFRQQFVKVVTCEDEVVGCSFSTMFNLKNDFYKKHSYFSSFTPEVHEILKQNGQSAISVEYLTSHPDWRKRDIGVSLGAVILGLDMKLMKSLGADLALGATRKDLKVNHLCAGHGWETLIPSFIKCKYECELMAAYSKKVRPYPDALTQQTIERLWQDRNDYRVRKSIFDFPHAVA